MPRNRKQKRDNLASVFEKLQPIDPDEFDTAINWAMNAANGKATVTDPTKMKLNIDLGNGESRLLTFPDIPINRAMMALKERYGGTEKMYAVGMRMFALFEIMHDPAMDKWMRKGQEGWTEVHPAVTAAAATVMLNCEGGFPAETFFAKVKELAETIYKDED